jgi:hypothetical protein
MSREERPEPDFDPAPPLVWGVTKWGMSIWKRGEERVDPPIERTE